ncbi:DUF6691 family protein [Psychromonas sp. KJ10-10]|uniref:DUF6691 family protein n=1 Tax=Psychromonas sp. KJ10-10 TaxID=3391823 RepID=UPI0039B3F7E1
MSKSKVIRIIVGWVSGALFGSGMIISGMVNPDKVIGFLNVTGNWDPSLIFVMGGALAVFAPFYHFIIKKRSHSISGDAFTWTTNTQVDGTLMWGAIIFGVGWGLAGFCPGPAISSVAGGTNIILAFILSMLVGIIHANQYLASRFPLPFVGYRKQCQSTKS